MRIVANQKFTIGKRFAGVVALQFRRDYRAIEVLARVTRDPAFDMLQRQVATLPWA